LFSRNATAPESGVCRIEGRDDRSRGKRDLALITSNQQAGLPNTAMAAAFLKALARLAARRPDRSTKITLPTGVTNIGGIELVLCALGLVRVMTMDGITAAKIVKSKPGWRRPGSKSPATQRKLPNAKT
jgi:hypothetical protein